MTSLQGPMDLTAKSALPDDDSQQLEAYGSSKDKHFWQRKSKDTDWRKEAKVQKDRAERLKGYLFEIHKTLREKGASLHRKGQSSLNDAIRSYDKPIDMTRALLTEFDAALEIKDDFEKECRIARRELSEMTGQLRAKEEEFNQRWRSHMSDVERKQIMDSHRYDAQGQEISNLKANLSNCKYLKEKAENEREALRSQKEDLESTIVDLESKHSSDIEKRETMFGEGLSKAEQRLEEERERHAQEIQRLNQGHRDRLSTKQEEFEDQTRILRNTIAEQQKTHKSRVARMQEEYDIDIEQLKQSHKTEVEELSQAISTLKQGHTAELERIEKRHSQKVLQLKRDFKHITSQRQATHSATEKSLRVEIAAYGEALLTRDKNDFNLVDRDNFEPMADTDIEAKFADLVQDVDGLSRLDWRVDSIGWTAVELRRMAENERLLRKQILQDIIWDLLHEHIFCSPFRIFGDQGQSLESQWNKECGTDNNLNNGHYIWPTPQMETERWRYITVRECRAALRRPFASQFDPRAELKKGFQASIERLRKGVVSALEGLVVLDPDNLQALNKMAVRAARTWLDFGLQRCRIVVLVQGSHLRDVEAMVQKTKEDGLNLVMVPKLMRYGNSKGQHLEAGEIIAGRDGEMARVGRMKT